TAISPTVKPAGWSKKIGSVIELVAFSSATRQPPRIRSKAGLRRKCSRPAPRSEPGPAAEAENLGPVAAFFGDRIRNVEAKRSERRVPHQADAGRRTDALGVADRQGFTRRARLRRQPGGRPAVVPQLAGIGECRDADAKILRQEIQRRLQ